ncbi:alpha-2-macroglobulin family protein [Diaphorobacter sp. HDW4A]|uniref:alpha-2-macroglobulin family protein n=1 Tax=Diaphorobacter sp. HDW4A TaxID=2714924 RepID=UPI00140D8DE6|nr:alpha-2-macroglobulin [Diaphorobacter sp. HDW4A]QIL83151.1 alpha-2-macroglobulin family protein [Diaphorobacter sp. HDW4A]
MLRLANQKLAAASEVLVKFLSLLWRPLAALLRLVFGSWQPPAWLAATLCAVRRGLCWLQQRLLLVVLLIALAAVAWFATPAVLKWWHGLTPEKVEPARISATATPPQRTRVEDSAPPNPLVLQFSGDAAPIHLSAGIEATGVSLEPAIAGKWTWEESRKLQFMPREDWPVGQPYSIRLADNALAHHVVLADASKKISFTSPAFAQSLQSAEFYQDPTEANVRRALYMVRFSHPVNTAEFEKRIALSYDKPCESGLLKFGESAKCEPLKYTVSYDKWQLTATILSEPLPIPEKTRSVILKIAKGTSAKRGGPGVANDLVRAVGIPGLYSLSISDVSNVVVNADNGEPGYVLNVTASMPVRDRAMAQVVQAWLLPAKHKNADGEPVDKFDWTSAKPAEFNDALLKTANKLTLDALPTERDAAETVSFRMPQATGAGGRYLLVRVAKGLKTPGGYQLGEARQVVLKLDPFAPQLSIVSQGSLLALSGEKKLPVLVRDLPGVRVELHRLLPKQLQHMVTQSNGDFSRPQMSYGLTFEDISDRFEKKIPLELKAGKAHYETVDFSGYLAKDKTDRRGVFLLTVQGYDPKAKQPKPHNEDADAEEEEQSSDDEATDGGDDNRNTENYKEQRLVLVTDLGIVMKKSINGTRDVFVQSIATGQPVGGAQVEVWGRNGVTIATQTTDATGRASLPSLAGFEREKSPVVLVVRKEGDMSFLPLNRYDRTLDVSRFDVGGVYAKGVPNQMQGFVFSDRGMYRPGDTMHLGIIVKAGNWNTSLRDLPVEVDITDARGLSVKREKLKLGAGGATEISHTTQDSSPTGNYTVNLYLPRRANAGTPEANGLLIGTTTVKVQEFLPDRTKVRLTLSQQASEGWVRPQDLKANVDVQNLFGTPAQDRKVEGTLTLTPAFPSFRSLPDYSFHDPQKEGQKQVDDLGSAQTSAEGQALFDLRLSRFEAATYQVHVLAKAFEPEGGRSVAAEAQTLVSDLPYLVGTKVDGDTRYVAKNAARNASIIAIDPKVQKTAVPNLKLQRIERKVISVLVKQDNGVFRYESRTKEIQIDEKPFAITAAGNTLALDTATPGDFAYIVLDEKNVALNRIDYSVAGNANVTRSLDRNAELQLALDKKDYEPGQEISVSIRAPYVGAGLITIERDKVYAHAWFKTDKTASVQKITVPKDFEGTGYITVHFVRDPSSDEVYMSPLSYGVAPFATTLAKRTANITLTSSELVKPGQTVKMTLASDQPTRAVVFAVDEGILQVARYKTPAPLKFFFQKRALEVNTLQTLDMILPEFKKLMLAAAPGGDGEDELGKHLNPFKRKRDKPIAYWSGLVDVNGSREFSYTVPESFNGSLRVMAVAVNDQSTAAKSTTTVVRGDMVILPNAPLAMAPGDTVEVGVGLANNIEGSGKNVPIALTLNASGGLEVVGGATQTLSINERGEASTKFKLRAKAGADAVLGSSPLAFSAVYKNFRADLKEEVSVRPASPYVSLVQAGSFQRSGEIKSQGDFFPNFRRSDVAVSSAPWSFATGLMQYLEAYPYGCTEQITSQTYPAVLLSTRPELMKEMSRGRTAEQGPLPDARKVLERYIVQLRARQTGEGGFSAWPGDATPDTFATLYAVQLLLEAKEHQLPVPQDLLQQANTYLQSALGNADAAPDNWRMNTQALYLLTRQGIVAPAALANLREAWRSGQAKGLNTDLGAAYLAASYQLVKQDKVAAELFEPVWKDLLTRTAKKQRRTTWGAYYDPLVHESMLVYVAARHFPEKLKTLPPTVWNGVAGMVQDGWYNSLSSASMVLAVDAYFNAVNQNTEGRVSVQSINAQSQAAALALGSINPVARAQVPVGTSKLKLANDSDFNLYYSWAEQGFERNVPDKALNKGMEIYHEVIDAAGKPVTQVKIGDEVTVRVRVRSTDRENLPDVALVDMLPGGLEPVLQPVSSGSADDEASQNEESQEPVWKQRLGIKGSWNLAYADIREDRVVFYGSVNKNMMELTYKARATNVGDFVVPPAYGEDMYDRRVFSRSAGARLQVVPK